MAAVVSIISRCGLRIEVHHRNQPTKTKLAALYKLLFQFKSPLKELYVSNKMEHFGYKGRCGICVLKHLRK